MGNVDLSYKEFKSKDELKSAIKSGEVDIAFIDFDYTNDNGLYTETVPILYTKVYMITREGQKFLESLEKRRII